MNEDPFAALLNHMDSISTQLRSADYQQLVEGLAACRRYQMTPQQPEPSVEMENLESAHQQLQEFYVAQRGQGLQMQMELLSLRQKNREMEQQLKRFRRDGGNDAFSLATK